jgi:phospholipase C
VANYATTKTGGPVPPAEDIADIMACCATPTQLPVIYQLATEFALCDQWYSSLPGPTWANRFFLHGASSSGLDATPTKSQIGGWEAPALGFQYPNGSIYALMKAANVPYRLYNDSTSWGLSLYSDDSQNGSAIDAVPQVTALAAVTILDIHSLQHFASDLQGPYPYPYTFIEPHYGDVSSTYAGGSSQHPMDDVYGGEHLLASVYAAIRNSPYWNTSLLIVTYDEHGGFYDSVALLPPRRPATTRTTATTCMGSTSRSSASVCRR